MKRILDTLSCMKTRAFLVFDESAILRGQRSFAPSQHLKTNNLVTIFLVNALVMINHLVDFNRKKYKLPIEFE